MQVGQIENIYKHRKENAESRGFVCAYSSLINIQVHNTSQELLSFIWEDTAISEEPDHLKAIGGSHGWKVK